MWEPEKSMEAKNFSRNSPSFMFLCLLQSRVIKLFKSVLYLLSTSTEWNQSEAVPFKLGHLKVASVGIELSLSFYCLS